jgi:hypothetical protein
MDAPIRITLHASRVHLSLLIASASISLLIISTLPIETSWRWVGYLGVSVGTARLLRRDVALQSKRSCIAFVYGKDRHISLELRDGERISGVVCADTLVLPWLVLLNVATAGHGGRSLLLFPDAMPADGHRRLRVLLRNSERLQS